MKNEYKYLIAFSIVLCFSIVFISKANKEKRIAEGRLEIKELVLQKELLLNEINAETERIKDSLYTEQFKIYLR